MPKLPPLTPRKVIQVLNKKGFVLALPKREPPDLLESAITAPGYHSDSFQRTPTGYIA